MANGICLTITITNVTIRNYATTEIVYFQRRQLLFSIMLDQMRTDSSPYLVTIYFTHKIIILKNKLPQFFYQNIPENSMPEICWFTYPS
jgi:ABC-type maltose transport system permease subunit